MLFLCILSCSSNKSYDYDICIYGGNSAGVIAAYTAAMKGKKVLLIEPGNRLGGLSAGGLGYTDIGNKQVITGLAKDFYRKLGTHYGTLEQWIFEPKVADSIFRDYIKKADVEVLYNFRIHEAAMSGKEIQSIQLESSDGQASKRKITARMYIDCSYEGDLMAKAGVSYTVGRESNATYQETYNGVQLMDKHQFPDGIDPYKIEGDSTSGLLWGISSEQVAPDGTGDQKVQAYNYRICLTNDPANRKEITRPVRYDSTKYELLIRLFEAQPDKRKLNDYFIWSHMPNAKTDINNRGGFSTDAIGMNHHFPEASYAERTAIIQEHKDYTQGLLYFYKTDPRVPAELRAEIQEWGYPMDEYTETDHWSPQLYLRETRRMIGEFVMTQAHCEGREVVNDGIAMAAYTMDSHNCQRIVVRKDGRHMVKNEGNVEIGGGLPYPISYRSITPKASECTNLLVPVCMSASHIAYGSIRMEPVFMVMAQAAALAAVEALATGSVQTVSVNNIQAEIKQNPFADGRLPEILMDDRIEDQQKYTNWELIEKPGGYGRSFYKAMMNDQQEPFVHEVTIARSGLYDVYTYYQVRADAAGKTDYTITNGDERHTASIRKEDVHIVGQTSGEWILLGRFDLDQNTPTRVAISSQSASGKVVADAVLLIPVASSEDD